MKKICKKCKKEKDILDFSTEFLCTKCETKRLWNKEYARKKREVLKNSLKVFDGNIICSTCKKEKHCSQFSKSLYSIKGYKYQCKKCDSISNKKTYFKDNWGISIEELNAMKLKQENKCACCEKESELVIDHNHKTGIFRDLVCNKCNTIIGLLDEDKEMIKKILNYIQKHDNNINPSKIKCLKPWRTSYKGKDKNKSMFLPKK